MNNKELKSLVSEAITACQEKKAEDITILELEQGSGAFTDYFLLCTGTNPRQVEAIAEEVEVRLKRTFGEYAAHTEGYRQAEWILLDYVDFVVHVFSDKARQFYDLERLWKSARRITPEEFAASSRKKTAVKTSAVKKAVVKKKAGKKAATTKKVVLAKKTVRKKKA